MYRLFLKRRVFSNPSESAGVSMMAAMIRGVAISATLAAILNVTQYKTTAEPVVTLSGHLLGLSGRSAGVCSMPRCGDGTLAVDIARGSSLIVHALGADPGAVLAARKVAEKAGLLNRAVYIEEGGVVKNPLADWCADLLVIDDASDADLDRIAPGEVRRVLSPYRGVAVVGRAKSHGAGLTRSRLDAWLKGLNLPGGKIVEDSFGLWAVAVMPPLAGGDDWTHYAHGPDQNRASLDDTLKWPYALQWAAKPYYDGKFDIAVAAGGRLFRANATLAVDNTKGTDGIIARAACNGSVLWKRKTADDFGTFGSLIVATPEVVYIKDGNGILSLDAETGAELKRFALTGDPKLECKWLALQDGVLIGVLGAKPGMKTLRDLPSALTKNSGFKMNSSEEFSVHQNWFLDYDQGTELVALDAASGGELWRQPAAGIDPAKTAIAAGRIFYYADHAYAACLDLKTGKAVWKTDAPILKNPVGTGWSFTFMITERVGAVASPEVYLINSNKDGHYQAFAAGDGKILWGEGHGRADQQARNERLQGKLSFPLFVKGKILSKDGAYLDPLTGKETGEKLPRLSWGTCGSICVSPHGLHGGGGTVYNLDAKAPTNAPAGYMKAACLSGVIAADGLLFSGHGNCSGCMEWLGHLAFGPAGDPAKGAAASPTERLAAGRAMESPGVAATPLDWTTYRANNSRSASSGASVSGTAGIAWTWTPVPSFDTGGTMEREAMEPQSTQSISAGDRVFFGTADGFIRCLDRKTGGEIWSFAATGRIISAPTFWEGKIYAGSGDGHVYCLNAKEGSLIWRYRVAPVERRIMVFGHLMSCWPVNANVLVQPNDGSSRSGAAVYATAGLIGPVGGSLICAMDARTGKPLWETRFTADSEILPSATGQMAWNNGKLWWHVGDSGVMIVDPATGKATPMIDSEKLDTRKSMTREHMSHATYAHMRGQDIGVLPGGWVVLGGRQFYLPLTVSAQPRNTCSFLKATPETLPPDANGYPNIVDLPGLHGTDAMPVWDEKEILLFGNRTQPPVLCAGFTGQLTAGIAKHPFDPAAAAKNFWNGGLQNVLGDEMPDLHPKPVLPAKQIPGRFMTPILAGNAVVFITGNERNWHVVAVNRADATILWDIAVPAQPVPGGLSLDGAGDVLAPLADGRVVCIGAR